MFEGYPGSGAPSNAFAFPPADDRLEAVAGQPSLQAMRVPFAGFSSAKACYYQCGRAFLEVPPERMEALPDGERTFLSWSLSPSETAALGGTLLDTLMQVSVSYPDGSEAVSEPVRVEVRMPLEERK